MANKTIKGLTVEIGGDTTKLGKALSEVDEQSRSLSGELREVDKLLKFDPKNTDLLAQRQKILADQIAATSEKLSILRESEEQVTAAFERGDASEEQVRALQREIIKTEQALSNQTSALDRTTEYLEGLKDGSVAAAEAEAEMKARTEKANAELAEQSRSLSEELREVDKLLKFDPKNTDLLAQKQEILTKQIAATSEKLSILRESEEQVTAAFERGDASEEQVRALQREIVKTEQALSNQTSALDRTTEYLEGLKDGSVAAAEAEAEMKVRTEKANAELAEQKKKAAEARKELGEYAEKGAAVAGKAAAGMAAAVVGATTALSALVLKEAENADELGDMAKRTGLSTEKLQEYRYVADKLGSDLETVTGAHTKLVQTMSKARGGTGDVAEAYRRLGINVEDGTQKLRNTDEVFLEAIDRLSRMEDGTERDALAMTIFGKSAQELNPLILAGSAGIKEYTDRAHELGVVVSDETVSALSEVQDGVKDVTFEFGAARQELAAEFAPVAGEALSALSELIRKGKDELKDPVVKKSVKELGESFGKLINKGSDLAVKVLPKLVSGLKFIIEHGKGAAIALGSVYAVLKGISVASNAAKAYNEVSSALKTLKTASEAAKTAQEGVAAASTASSAAAAAGWGALVLAVVGALALVITKEKEHKDEITAVSRDIKQAVDDIVQSQQEAASEYSSTSQEIETSAHKAEEYLSRLEELEGQTSLTSEEQAEYNRLIAALHSVMPELNTDIDENTGRLSESASALKSQIEQLKERAKFLAVEERYTSALKNNIALTQKKKEADNNLAKARKKHADMEETWLALQTAMHDSSILMVNGIEATAAGCDKAQRLLGDYAAELYAAEEAAAAANEAFEASEQDVSSLGEAYEAASTAINSMAESAEKSTGPVSIGKTAVIELRQEMKKAGEQADELAQDHLSKVIGAAQNMFDEIDTGSRTSMQELIETLKHNKQVMTDWDDNLARIYARGASEEFVKYLEGLGLSYADQVDMIANSTDEEFEELMRQWEKNSGDAYDSAAHYADMIVQGIIDRLEERRRELERAGFEAGNAVARGFENSLEISSPSRRMGRDADYSAEGYIDSFEERIPDLAKVSAQGADAVARAFDPTLGISAGALDRVLYTPPQTLSAQMGADISSLGGRLDAILRAIEAGQIIALDGDKLVGGTIGRINAELGEELILSERRKL